jgi:hypothetical protein
MGGRRGFATFARTVNAANLRQSETALVARKLPACRRSQRFVSK